MKVIHISENYIEGWGYQENLLPLYQKRAGHDVVVISDNGHLKYVQNQDLVDQIIQKGIEYEYDGIKIYKIKTYLNTSSASFFCCGLSELLEKEQPDMIFHHNVNMSTLLIAARYKRHHPLVKLYADNHADWINESKNKLWHKVFYDTLIPLMVKWLGNKVNYYIGVSPLRCLYLNRVFQVPADKVRFLPIGCDTVGAEQVTESREELRKHYHLKDHDFVVISGGKLDRSKGTLALVDACEQLQRQVDNLHLVLFGQIDEEVMQAGYGKTWLTIEGWCDRKKTLSLLKMSDVACWPWLHTTLIEDSIASCVPLVVKMSDNVSHFAKERAGFFMEKGDVDDLMRALVEVKTNAELYRQNVVRARRKYSYEALIKRLEDETFCEL